MGWAAIGGALVVIGASVGAALATWGAGSHLWGDDAFLAGFAAAAALTGLGVYALVGEFIGGLPLPPTRYERSRAAPRQAEREDARALLAEECARQAQRIEDYMLSREADDPRNQHQHGLPPDEHAEQQRKQSAYWHETGRLFHHRLGSDTRRLLEALRDEGLLDPDRLQKMEIIRLSKANPGEIHELGHMLRSAAHTLEAETR